MFGRKELKNYNATAEELASFQWAKMTTSKGVMWIKYLTPVYCQFV